jgi:3-carboxy-cis,cis-muconate cycloisomerase
VVAAAVREARATGRPLTEVLSGRPDVDVARLSRLGAPDVGEAAAQVDAALAAHRDGVAG